MEEENKNLISLRTSLIPVIVVLSGGIAGLLFAAIPASIKIGLIIIGVYLEFMFIGNLMYANNKINENIGVMKNERK